MQDLKNLKNQLFIKLSIFPEFQQYVGILALEQEATAATEATEVTKAAEESPTYYQSRLRVTSSKLVDKIKEEVADILLTEREREVTQIGSRTLCVMLRDRIPELKEKSMSLEVIIGKDYIRNLGWRREKKTYFFDAEMTPVVSLRKAGGSNV